MHPTIILFLLPLKAANPAKQSSINQSLYLNFLRYVTKKNKTVFSSQNMHPYFAIMTYADLIPPPAKNLRDRCPRNPQRLVGIKTFAYICTIVAVAKKLLRNMARKVNRIKN